MSARRPPPGPAPAEGQAKAQDARAPLAALRDAFDAAAAALRAAVASPAAALRAVAVADHSLQAAPGFYAALESVIASGDPAPEVAADLRRYAERAARLDREIAPLRARLGDLRRAEEELSVQAARKDGLLGQIAELERIERLASDVGQLESQKQQISERVRGISASVTASEGELAEVTGPLLVLTDEALANLAGQTRALLKRAHEQDELLRLRLAERRQAAEETARARGELDEAETGLAQARAEYDSACAEAASRLSALRRYQAASRDIAQALAGQEAQPAGPAEQNERDATEPDPLTRAVTALDEVEAQLAGIDALLGAALSPGKD
jgi:hypothetical protein